MDEGVADGESDGMPVEAEIPHGSWSGKICSGGPAVFVSFSGFFIAR